MPLLCSYDITTKKIKIYKETTYPDISSKSNFYTGFLGTNISLVNNNIFLFFQYSPTIYVVDTQIDKVKTIKTKSNYLDTIILPQEFSPTDLYLNVLEQNYKGIYLRKILYNLENKQIVSILMFDSNFSVVGEFIMPPKYHLVFIDSNLFFGFNPEKNSLVAFKPTMKQMKLDNWLKENDLKKKTTKDLCNIPQDTIPPKDIKNYLQDKIKKENYIVTIVPEYACTHCIEYVFTEFSLNKDAFEDYDIYLILSAKNKDFFNNISKYNLSSYSKIIIDSLGEYYSFNKGYINVHFIEVKNNEIKFNKVYIPDKMQNWMMKISFYIDSLDMQK